MNKIFGIYFSDPNALGYPLNKKVFFEAYGEIIEALEQRGIQTVIVRHQTYLGKGVFSHYFKWSGNTYEKVSENIKLDLLWNRDSENVIPHITDLEIINRFEFDDICRDKVLTYENFKEFSGKTYLLNSYEDLKNNIDNIPSQKIVLKPRFGEQCMGIHVIEKNEIHENLYQDWTDILLQEFLDSSNGIPELIEGLHEIQIFCINGVFAGSRIKQPAPGSYVSSATGSNIGTVRGLKKSEVPKELLDTMSKLDESISRYPLRLYRADFVYTENGYRMIEINSRPGVMHKDKEGADYYWDFNGQIVNLIEDYLR